MSRKSRRIQKEWKRKIKVANHKLESSEDTSGMTLEEIMMSYYNRPCYRVSPGHREAWGYERGSQLVYKDRVILVLNPEDNSLYGIVGREDYVGPHYKRFLGLEIGTRLVKNGRMKTIIDVQRVRIMRHMKKDPKFFSMRSVSRSIISEMAERHRCPETTGLYGRLDALRLQRICGEVNG